ncbi:lamin tail domain-containing protein [Pontiellaceae bacterium B12219]|nr:lamin tail domain-containing protein [Pontiellaceae bacterium B12219]
MDWILELHLDATGIGRGVLCGNHGRRLKSRNGWSAVPNPGKGTVGAADGDFGFGFSELGSDAYLQELSGTNIVRIVDGVSFPAVEREEPFGRYERSDGEIDFTELLNVTPGAANALPRVGPVVISEIMFAPDAGYSEYVEIMNISDTVVSLYDPVLSSNVWKFSGVGDFSFPAGTTLAPNETAILCATNPAIFRLQYGVDSSISVFGPWPGGLALEGEKLQLLYPGDPELDGTVPMYRVDHVSYRTNSMWAVANRGGVSLERRPLNGYGNDPSSWRTSLAGGSPGKVMGDTYPMGMTLQFSGAVPTIAFATVVGEAYEVRYSDSLMAPEWQLLESIPSATTPWIEVIDPSPSRSNRYYRILWDW